MTSPSRISPDLLDRTPPHDMEAERAALGCILLDAHKLDDVAAIVRPEDFYADANQRLFIHLVAMAEVGPIDVELLRNRLKQAGDLEAVGGSAYLSEVLGSVPYSHHAKYYARIVRRKAAFRRLIHAGSELVRQGYGEDGEPEAVVDAAEATLREAWHGEHDRGPVSACDAITDWLVDLENARQGKSCGVLTGLETYDRNHGGLFPGELVIVAARPGIGKTALASQIALHSAERGRRVYFVSLEMPAKVLLQRVICAQTELSTKLVRTGHLDDKQADRLVQVSQELARLPLFVHDAPMITVGEIRRTARRFARDGLALVVVDYLQRVEPRDRKVNRDQQVGEMSAGLKSLALELEVPVLCLAQVNRMHETEKKPRLGHLRESGNIEADSDVIAMVTREEEKTDPTVGTGATLHVLKNRNGEVGDIPLVWIPARTRFECPGGWV